MHNVCKKKKPNFDFWLTIWPSFEIRKIFLETFLHLLLMFATSAACLQLLQVGDVLKLALLAWSRTLDLKGAVFVVVFSSVFLVFLSRRYQHAFCFRRIQYHPISTTPPRDIIYTLL